IGLYNHSRRLVRELCQLRVQQPHLLPAWESYVLIRAGNLLPVEQHIAILEDALAKLKARQLKKRDSIRIVVEGSFCEQPPLLLIAKFCEPAYFDHVPFKQELDRAGIPHLQLEFEEKLFTFDRVRTEVETFVESLVFD